MANADAYVSITLTREATDYDLERVKDILNAMGSPTYYSEDANGQEITVGMNDWSIGYTGNAAEALRELFDMQYTEIFVSEGPAEEWLGTLCRLRPGEPEFKASCDNDGNVVLTEQDVRNIITEFQEDHGARLDASFTLAERFLRAIGDAVGPNENAQAEDGEA